MGLLVSLLAKLAILHQPNHQALGDQLDAMVTKLYDLPPQQKTITRMVALGMTRIEIALTLGLSPKTVEYHCRKTYRQLGINDVVRLTHLAILAELVKLGECLCERNAVRT